MHADFTNDVYHVPFFVAIDEKRKTVVISVRGTLSLSDAIVDMDASPIPIVLPGNEDSEDCYVHSGMWRSAGEIERKIDGLLLSLRNDPVTSNHHLVVTGVHHQFIFNQFVLISGHSLGAGVAALLALRLSAAYPSIRCYAYSPPGSEIPSFFDSFSPPALVSAQVSDYLVPFVVSVIPNVDLVPRISRESIKDLQNRLIDELYRSPYPKCRIHCSTVCGCCLPPHQVHLFKFASFSSSLMLRSQHRGVETASRKYLMKMMTPMTPRCSVPEGSILFLITAFLKLSGVSTDGDEYITMSWDKVDLGDRGHTLKMKMYCPGRVAHLVPTVPAKKLSDSAFRAIWR